MALTDYASAPTEVYTQQPPPLPPVLMMNGFLGQQQQQQTAQQQQPVFLSSWNADKNPMEKHQVREGKI